MKTQEQMIEEDREFIGWLQSNPRPSNRVSLAEWNKRFVAFTKEFDSKHGIGNYVQHENPKPVVIEKEKHPLDYGFVRFFKDGGKWTYKFEKTFTNPYLTFSVFHPMYCEPLFEEDRAKSIAENLNCKWANRSEEEMLKELEWRGRRFGFDVVADYETDKDLLIRLQNNKA